MSIDEKHKIPQNVAEVRDVILQERRRTIRNICNIVNLSYGVCQRILPGHLNMRHIAGKFVATFFISIEQRRHLMWTQSWKKLPKETLLATNPWCTDMIPKQSSCHCSGRRHRHHDRREHGKFDAMSSWCRFAFLISVASRTKNFSHYVKQLMDGFIAKFFGDWEKRFVKWRNNFRIVHLCVSFKT